MKEIPVCAVCHQPITDDGPIYCGVCKDPMHDDCCASDHVTDPDHLCENCWPDNEPLAVEEVEQQ